jgi:hypothetical protein
VEVIVAVMSLGSCVLFIWDTYNEATPISVFCLELCFSWLFMYQVQLLTNSLTRPAHPLTCPAPLISVSLAAFSSPSSISSPRRSGDT